MSERLGEGGFEPLTMRLMDNYLTSELSGDANVISYSTFFIYYKITLYKNTEARFALKIITRLEHAQLQMRN